VSKRKKVDKIDWRDDVLSGIELAIAIIMGILFYNYLQLNPEIATILMPETLGMFIISFGLFIGAFLFVRWLNREMV
jgi:hypothetical protein